MFNHHQAEITVMQFRGYSLPVHDCNGTTGPSPCPISYALIRPRDLFRLLAVGMCHFLPVYYLGIVFLGRVEGQNITLVGTTTLDQSEPGSNGNEVNTSLSPNLQNYGLIIRCGLVSYSFLEGVLTLCQGYIFTNPSAQAGYDTRSIF